MFLLSYLPCLAIVDALGPAEAPTLPVNNVAATVAAVANVVEKTMGGTSGAVRQRIDNFCSALSLT